MGLLRLVVLGPPEIFHDGSRLTFALHKAQALLLYLAVEGGLHSRSKLAAFLWPDSEPPAACACFSSASGSPPGKKLPGSWSRSAPPCCAGWRSIGFRRRPLGA